MTFEILDRFSKNTQIQNFMKIRLVGDQLCHADRQTDVTKLIIIFPNFTSSSKKKDMPSKNITYKNHNVRGHLRDVGVTGTITLKIYRGELWCEDVVWTQLRTVPKYATTPSFNIK
jgi:hypothetical protein